MILIRDQWAMGRVRKPRASGDDPNGLSEAWIAEE